jgi:conjugal transfer ATP-binding protein TraC
MLNGLKNLVYGREGGATYDDLGEMLHRDKLSEFLPWVAYDPDTHVYVMQDDSTAFMWECAPLFFAGENTVKTLESLFRQGLPDKTIAQFVLTADPNISPVLQGHINTKKRPGKLIQRSTQELCKFYDNGKMGMDSLGGMPLRNFRLFVCVKMPTVDAAKLNLKELHVNLSELLDGAQLHPRDLVPEVLLDFMRRLLNDDVSLNNFGWDHRKAIRKQCIFSGTETDVSFDKVTCGKKIFKCTTPLSFPGSVYAFQTNQLFGSVDGNDAEQIRTPFIYSLNIVFRDMSKNIHTKCNLINGQQGLGSFAPSLRRKKEEFMWAAGALSDGTRFMRVIPTLWVYGEDEDAVTGSLARAKQMWEGQGYVMQTDKGILMPLFLASLPGGLVNNNAVIDQLDRDHVAPVDTISEILPVQGDFTGFGDCVMPLIGRKGQLLRIDLWAYNSHNALVCAQTGGGKSFFLNSLLNHAYGTGAKIRVVDIGRSYKKMTNLHGAKFLDFAPGNDICLNPFSSISNNPDEPDDTEGDLMAIPGIVAQMCYSTGDGSPTATDMTLIEQAVRWAFKEHGREAGSDEVKHYLTNFRKYNPEGDGGQLAEERAQMLAFNMSKFCTGGAYGRFFNGKATFNIQDDDFVVLELEHLQQHKALFNVVTLQVINAVTQDLYLGDKNQKKLIVFDEAWKFLGESNAIRSVIEEGYRRARKYNGSFTIVTQSILDMLQFGSVGKVIRNNSAFKFYLQSGDFVQALNEKLVDYSEFVMDILKSMKSKPPKYSEIFIDSPFGVGIGRLAVDPYNYYVNTSEAWEVQEIDDKVDGGMDVEEAIDAMVRKYRSN